MTARPLLQMLRHPIPWGRGLVVAMQQRANRQRICRGLVLVAYLVMNLGLPTGLGPKVAAAATDKGCHCSAESRAAGRCCCSVRAGLKPRGCCASPVAAVAKSCCARKTSGPPVETKVSRSEPSAETPLAWSGACPCSPGDGMSMLLCAHPRILIAEGGFELCAESSESILLSAVSPCGNRARPCVPPPEVALV